MDWKSLFLSADGRIRRSEFWIGWLVIFAVNALLGWVIPLLSILLIYPTVCIFSKRLHDMGKTGWLQLAPIVVQHAGAVARHRITGGAAARVRLGG